MGSSALNQFGSVMTYAISLEGSLIDYYANAASENNISKHKDELMNRLNSSKKRKKKLERSRRENITEITLEPIVGLDKTNYILNQSNYDLVTINSNEEVVIRFYTDAGPKLNVLESRRLFKQCLKEHNNLTKLE